MLHLTGKRTFARLEEIINILNDFEPVTLDTIDNVKLMNRIDRKYWHHKNGIAGILREVLPYYDVLEINGQRLMEYKTTYFDTPDDKMYKNHHNGKLNRYKIRKRRYLSTNSNFLEIKQKNNKQRTIKERIEMFQTSGLTEREISFIDNSTPFSGMELQPVLWNNFQRVTLVSKLKTDRCTIDFNLVFENDDRKVIELRDLAIIEIKRSQALKSSPLMVLLREKKIRQRGMSKYCTGRALLDQKLKQNAFKARLRFLKKQ